MVVEIILGLFVLTEGYIICNLTRNMGRRFYSNNRNSTR